jgi:hypothetical protein
MRIEPIPKFLHVADHMVSFMWQSCCGERAGSHINWTKTKSRTGLRADTSDSLTFTTFNMPYLHEMDFAAFVMLFAKEEHQISTTKESIRSESVSKLVRRHLATKTDKFHYKNLRLKTFSDIGAVKSIKSTLIESQNQTRFPLPVAPAFGLRPTKRV